MIKTLKLLPFLALSIGLANISFAENDEPKSSINSPFLQELAYGYLKSYSAALDSIHASIFSSEGKTGDELISDLEELDTAAAYLSFYWDDDDITIPQANRSVHAAIIFNLRVQHISLSGFLQSVDQAHRDEAIAVYKEAKESTEKLLMPLQVESKTRLVKIFE
jgi:hypothetical protein